MAQVRSWILQRVFWDLQQENLDFRFKTGSFREWSGCWGIEKPELLSKCCRMCQRSGRRHRTEGIIPQLSLAPQCGVSSGCEVCGAPLGAALSLFITVSYPSPSLLDQLLTQPGPGLGFVFVLITVYIISSQHVEVIESCSSKLPISSSHQVFNVIISIIINYDDFWCSFSHSAVCRVS